MSAASRKNTEKPRKYRGLGDTVTTVTGPIDADELGVTLAHEHLFLDLRNQFTLPKDPAKRKLSSQKIQMEHLGVLRRNPYALRDNLLLDDMATAVKEVLRFKALGGRSIVDCTSAGIYIREQPKKLRELSRRTGVHVVAGCGYYTYDTHPPQMDRWSAEQIAEGLLRDLQHGLGGTDIRAGVIGEIGTSNPIRPNERKNLVAAALAFRKHPAGIQVHTYPWAKEGLVAADVLISHGVDPARIVICHVDVAIDLKYIFALLKKGVLVEFDNFGKEFYIDPADRGFAGGVFARDLDRVQTILKLLDRGYEKQVLVTNDVCLKCMLHRYGGWGYEHLLQNVVPMMRHEGISQATIDTFLIANPRRVMAH